MTNLEHKLTQLKKTVTLTETEKSAGRARLSAYLTERPAPKAVRSSFSFVFATARYALAAILIIGTTGTGVAFAAENAEPGHPLYVVRVRITEPARVALERDVEKRADLELALVDKRLEEFAQISVEQEPDSSVALLILDSLSDRLEDAHRDIATIRAQEAGELAALDAATELHATLAANTEVLERISEEGGPGAEGVETAMLAMTEDVADAARVADDIGTTAALSAEPSALTKAVVSKAEDVNANVGDISNEVSEKEAELDAEDYQVIGGALVQLRAVVDAANDKKDGGDDREALRLFGEANQQATRLKTLIEADTNLGIDLSGD